MDSVGQESFAAENSELAFGLQHESYLLTSSQLWIRGPHFPASDQGPGPRAKAA